jgi:3-phenylpropionate/trans-cinnamate dioxygenase ferredoxin reductase component
MTSSAATTDTFTGQIVIVGASLAGLRAAEALRREGFTGRLTLIGDEPHRPYDRPPLSKTVLSGWLPVEHTTLPQFVDVDAEWRLGVPAAELDRAGHRVRLADSQEVEFDRLLITTGTRARQWPNGDEGALDGVFSVRTRDDAAQLRERLAAGPDRVLIVGGGFIGSEVASVCRELDLPVTLAERGPAPLSGALGTTAGGVTARLQRHHGVDLRSGVTVMALEGDGSVRRARLSDGDVLDVDIVVIALGAIRNTEWLRGSGLAADARGVVCDASCRVFDKQGVVLDDVFVAGDVARWPHPLFDGQLIAVEHWSNAVEQAAVAAHNMVRPPAERRAHSALPTFWSNQFGLNIKSVGLPTIADELVVTQGAVPDLRFVAVYGGQGRIVAAVAVNAPLWLDFYQEQIATRAPFPPAFDAADAPAEAVVRPAGFPPEGQPTHSPVATVTGPGPSSPAPPAEAPLSRPTAPTATALQDPRVPPGPHPL